MTLQVNYWVRDTGLANLERDPDMGITLNSANEFLESHRKLSDGIKVGHDIIYIQCF